MKHTYTTSLVQTSLFSLLFILGISASAQLRHDHSNCSNVHVCGLQPIYENMNTSIAPPADFEYGADRDVTISVTYNGFSTAAQTAFQYAVDIWASLLTSDVPILVEATWEDIPGTTLGFAGAEAYFINFVGAPENDTYYPSALADKLAGYDVDPGYPDINASFDSGTDWYFGLDANPGPGEFDFVTVVLHELGHGLGVIGSGDMSGSIGYMGLGFGEDPIIYDTYVENGSGVAITDYSSGSTTLGNQLTSGNLFWNGTEGVAANSGNEPSIYAPFSWEPGSSYSHVDENSYPAGTSNSLMTPFVGWAEANHDPGPIIMGLMADIGWTVEETGGGGCVLTGVDFSVGPCDGDNPAITMFFDIAGGCTISEICSSENGGTFTCEDIAFLEIGDGEGVNFNAALADTDYNFYFVLSDGTVSSTYSYSNGNCSNLETICDCSGTEHTIGVLAWLGDGFPDDSQYEWEGQIVDFDCADWGYDCGDIAGSPSDDPYNVCGGGLPPNNGCEGAVFGCTDPTALNYNPNATVDDGSCIYDQDCVIEEDFDNYSNGAYVALSSPNITTWNDNPGSVEDAFVTNTFSFSPPHSMMLEQTDVAGGPTDIYIPLGDFTGTWNASWMMYVPAGFGAYVNVQEDVIAGIEWGVEVFFNDDGTVDVLIDALPIGSGVYAQNSWNEIELVADLNANNGVLLINGAPIANIPWDFDFGGVNFFPFQTEGTALYYVDDFSYCESDAVLGCTDFTATNYSFSATLDDGSCFYDDDCLTTMTLEERDCIDFGGELLPSIEMEFTITAGCTVEDWCIAAAGQAYECFTLADFEIIIEDGDILFFNGMAPNTSYSIYYTLSDGTVSDEYFIVTTDCLNEEYICDCDGNQHTIGVTNFLGNLFLDNGDGSSTWVGVPVNFNCETWGYDCGDGGVTIDPNGVCEGNLPPNNGCLGEILGCTDPLAVNWDPTATVDDGSCFYEEILGCTDPTALNYNPAATTDDGSCVYPIEGCTDVEACNYNPDATVNDGSCDYSCYGCTDPNACNYDADATVNDGTCDYSCYGCTDPEATNYDATATIDDGSCIYDDIAGCTDPNACNYDPFANVDDGSCEYVTCAGCTDPEACNYEFDATIDDGSCDYECYGCTDPEATNYDVDATIDDGSCVYGDIEGCTDPEACNYDEFATIDDGSCEYETCAGCTDSEALNYDPTATIDDGSCVYDCEFPLIDYTTFCEDGENDVFYIEMDINDLGNGAPYLVSNNQNDDEIELTFNGIIELGPFDNDDQVVVTVESLVYDCLITSPLLTDNCAPDNVDELTFESAVVYPNPNDGRFFLSTGDHTGPMTIDIYDITGKLLVSDQITVVPNEQRELNLRQDLAFGTYLMRIGSDQGTEQFTLIVR